MWLSWLFLSEAGILLQACGASVTKKENTIACFIALLLSVFNSRRASAFEIDSQCGPVLLIQRRQNRTGEVIIQFVKRRVVGYS